MMLPNSQTNNDICFYYKYHYVFIIYVFLTVSFASYLILNPNDIENRILFIGGLIYFLSSLLLLIHRLLFYNIPVITISELGISICRNYFDKPFIAWNDIKKIEAITSLNIQRIEITTFHKTFYVTSLSLFTLPKEIIGRINSTSYYNDAKDNTDKPIELKTTLKSVFVILLSVVLLFFIFMSPLFFEKYFCRNCWKIFINIWLWSWGCVTIVLLLWYYPKKQGSDKLNKQKIPFKYFITTTIIFLSAMLTLVFFSPGYNISKENMYIIMLLWIAIDYILRTFIFKTDKEQDK